MATAGGVAAPQLARTASAGVERKRRSSAAEREESVAASATAVMTDRELLLVKEDITDERLQIAAAESSAAVPAACQLADRCCGLLLGLAAGDHNGGPIQMALAIAEQLVQSAQGSSGGSGGAHAADPKDAVVPDPAAGFATCAAWWDDGAGVDAWDTGPITGALLQDFQRRGGSRAVTGGNGAVGELEAAACRLDRELKGMTAGVNAAHRVAPLALAGGLPDGAALASAGRQESRLTHASPISQFACALVVCLCRGLLRGLNWPEATAAARAAVVADSAALMAAGLEGSDEAEAGLGLVLAKFDEGCECCRRGGPALEKLPTAARGGFAPQTIKAAVAFVGAAGSFEAALRPALKFAGPPNYCPVLVGALAGARFGATLSFTGFSPSFYRLSLPFHRLALPLRWGGNPGGAAGAVPGWGGGSMCRGGHSAGIVIGVAVKSGGASCLCATCDCVIQYYM